MDQNLYTINNNALDNLNEQEVLSALESGKIIYLPNHTMQILSADPALFSDNILPAKRKNISYDYTSNKLSGCVRSVALTTATHQLMHQYALYARQLVDTLLPQYTGDLIWGRTSYRPAQIKGRVSSKRKDDTRIHVDAFSATPVNGLRIFRVFCNINPHGEPRAWQVGEPFADVLKKFSSKLPGFNPTKARVLHLIKATKTKRSAYDHYMLHLHDQMKLDEKYQQQLQKQAINFPAQSTWLVFTDHVSHAALSGQFLLEQTFYLPVTAMANPALSPLKQLQAAKLMGCGA